MVCSRRTYTAWKCRKVDVKRQFLTEQLEQDVILGAFVQKIYSWGCTIQSRGRVDKLMHSHGRARCRYPSRRVVGAFDHAVLSTCCFIRAQSSIDTGRRSARVVTVGSVQPSIAKVEDDRCILDNAASASRAFGSCQQGMNFWGHCAWVLCIGKQCPCQRERNLCSFPGLCHGVMGS